LLSPSDAALRGRIGAYRTHSLYSPVETTEKARRAFLNKFIDEVDPLRQLPEPERIRRATAARKAHFAGLSLKSAQARAKTKKTTAGSVATIPAAVSESCDAEQLSAEY
jgi:hypothetical protein